MHDQVWFAYGELSPPPAAPAGLPQRVKISQGLIPLSEVLPYPDSMECQIRYDAPDGSLTESRELQEELTVGRAPGEGGIALVPEDQSISRRTAELEIRDMQLVVRNVGTYKQIDIHSQSGVRHLLPGEEMRISSSVTIVIAGEIYTHEIMAKVTGAEPVPVTAGDTAAPSHRDLQIPEERLPAVIALCAPHFYPDRYGKKLMSYKKIAKLLTGVGIEPPPTASAIDKKLSRTRIENINEKHGLFIDTREELVDFVVLNGIVTREDVDNLLHK